MKNHFLLIRKAFLILWVSFILPGEELFSQIIATGFSHSLSICSDSTAWAWGYNYWGQVGDGSKINRIRPRRISGLTNIVAISGGINHSLALRSDSTLWAWGDNQSGQFGAGTIGNYSTVPVQVSSALTSGGIMAIACGQFHSLALRSDSTVWAWGDNSYGQFGNGTSGNISPLPLQVSGLSGIVAVFAQGGYSLALKSDSTVWAWGYNLYGELGDGTTIHRDIPVQVLNLSGVVAIAGGPNHCLALKHDSTVWSWGNNTSGQLGDSTTTQRNIAGPVAFLSDVVAITGGGSHSLAIRQDSTVWAWGYNLKGQLGDGTYQDKLTPVQVPGLSNVTSLTAGDRHSLVLRHDKTAWAFGYNFYGQLGIGGAGGSTSIPVQVTAFCCPGINSSISASRCSSYVSPSGKYIWTTSGLYSDTIINSIGCDSIIEVNLTINNTVSSQWEKICDQYVSPSGKYTWTNSGIYIDTIANTAGCDSIVTIHLTNNSTSSQQTVTACNSYTSPSGKYTWTINGTYIDTLVNAAGCDSVMTFALGIIAIDTSVNVNAPIFTSNQWSAGYQWIDCSNATIIAGATAKSYTAIANGSYAVIITSLGCIDTSNCYAINNVGIFERAGSFFEVYPNPARGSIEIKSNQLLISKVEVFNTLGKKIKNKEFDYDKEVKMDVSDLSTGLYFIKVFTDYGVVTSKLLKE